MRNITRSGQERLGRCKRSYYWGTIYLQTGLDTNSTDPNLALGIMVHKGMEYLMRGEGIDSAVVKMLIRDGALDQNALWLAEALVRGWARVRLPEFMNRYEILCTEKEMRVPLASNVVLQLRADAAVRRRSDGTAWCLNWKTTSSLYDWSSRWTTDIQSWTEAWGLQESLGIPISGVLYEGLYKGQKRNGRYTSLLIRGYRKGQADGSWIYKTGSAAGYKPFDPAVDFPGGLRDWVAFLPEDEVAAQFVTSYPILKDDAVVDQWIRSTVREETDIEGMLDPEVSEDDRLVYFRQRFGAHCNWCCFRPACLLQTDVDSMLADNLLVPRIDHHKEGEDEGSTT